MIKIPRKKPLEPAERIKYYQEELRKKDEQIKQLRQENELLMRASVRNAKRRLEEMEKSKQE
ncbi:hypothetical protein COV13_00425 [Candidatus Woesearchaeota archaeon CG10_big_fil_rev_8_21_14_0_10_32_9]|nr:MAG: hypothetical protein COV13_00425 [Candidatus Woesearchaeota archaeon CG10_big_fil_rev_8_21_14_0_10_32_9]